MRQIEKINIELQLIQNGMRIISNLTNDFHESESNSEIVKKLQNDTMDLFNEFTLKIQDLREEIYDNLNGLDVVFEEDINYVEACINLMNASDFE
mgnify:FL=1